MAFYMRTLIVVTLALALNCFGLGGSANAIPKLQLNIDGGVYDPVTETIMATSNPFDLYAFAYTSDSLTFEDIVENGTGDDPLTYMLSVALTPKVEDFGSSDPDWGSFTIAGDLINETVAVTADMIYGNPPIAADQGSEYLASHGIFDTYYLEFEVVFDPGDEVSPYNTQDFPGVIPSGTGMYYDMFTVDISGLTNPDIGLHFDLYALTDEGTLAFFAPFSHDAGTPPVPEPATFLLVGSGMAALGFYRRRSGRK